MNRQQRRAHQRKIGRTLNTSLTIRLRRHLPGHPYKRPWEMLRDDTRLPIGFYETVEQAEAAARSTKFPYKIERDTDELTDQETSA